MENNSIVDRLLKDMDNIYELGKQRAFELGNPFYAKYEGDGELYHKEMPTGEVYLVKIKVIYDENDIAAYFFYFDRTDFVYTGLTGKNLPVISFYKSTLTAYKASELQYPQKFAAFAFQNQRLNQSAYDIITANVNYQNTQQL